MVFNSLNEFNIYNETDNDLTNEIECIKKIIKHALKYEKVKNSSFNIIIFNKYKIYKTYRKKDAVTDVISFALTDNEDHIKLEKTVLGDIYICLEQAKKQAKEYGHSEIRELCFLSVHGFLHLLVYDHMNEAEEK